MLHVDIDPAVRALARRMGIRVRRGLASEIRRLAMANLQKEMDRHDMVPTTLDEVLEIAAGLYGMDFERVASDYDLSRIDEKYGRELPQLEGQLSFEFGAATEAVVLRRPQTAPHAAGRYLAVVDARGQRANKAWFGARHEAAHVLLPDDSNQQLFRRTTADRPEPFEQVIDFIASELGFWPPLVVPRLRAQLATGTDILDAFEQTRRALAPTASVEAAFRAFATHVDEPLLIVWCDMATRSDGHPDSLALRVQTVITNDAARARRLFIPPNYRVPPDSAIARAHSQPSRFLHRDLDSLGRWSDSRGRTLPALSVHVTARGRWAALRLQ